MVYFSSGIKGTVDGTKNIWSPFSSLNVLPVFRHSALWPCLRRHRTSAKEVSNALLAVWTVVEMNLQVNGMLALAIIATKVNFVCWHVPSSITTTLNCHDTTVKFVPGSGKILSRLCIDVRVILYSGVSFSWNGYTEKPNPVNGS